MVHARLYLCGTQIADDLAGLAALSALTQLNRYGMLAGVGLSAFDGTLGRHGAGSA